jgi:hypothetical protein
MKWARTLPLTPSGERHNMKNILSVATLAAIVSAGAAQAGPNLVKDGSFATTTSGFYYGVGNNQFWSNIGYYGDSLHGVTSDPLPNPPLFSNGNTLSFAGGPTPPYNFAYMDAQPGYLDWAFTQTINGLTPGKSYKLTFLANYFTENNSPGAAAGWTVNFGGTTNYNGQISFTGGDTESTAQTAIPQGPGGYNVPNGTGWVPESLTITANGASDALTFLATGSGYPPFAAVTNISLTLAAPEPSVWVMMLAGVSGLGFMARRQRARSAAAASA